MKSFQTSCIAIIATSYCPLELSSKNLLLTKLLKDGLVKEVLNVSSLGMIILES